MFSSVLPESQGLYFPAVDAFWKRQGPVYRDEAISSRQELGASSKDCDDTMHTLHKMCQICHRGCRYIHSDFR